MKNFITLSCILLSVQGALGQGTVRNVNNVTGLLSARIYGVDPANPTVQKQGNDASGVPAGSTVYGGAALAGTGFTVQLWGIGGTTADRNSLQLAINGTSSFRTGSAAGIWTETLAIIPNAPGGSGSHATLEVRVWDNKGGTITTWEAALAAWHAGTTFLATSPLFGVDNLGDGGVTPPAILLNLRSFNTPLIPEPSILGIATACGLGLLLRKRR